MVTAMRRGELNFLDEFSLADDATLELCIGARKVDLLGGEGERE